MGYNLGLSHGLPSIIVCLALLHKAGIQSEKVSELLQGAVNYLLKSKRNTSTHLYQFPGSISDEEADQGGGRLAWCYYDMGISVALWQAGQLFNNNAWKQEAIDVLLHTTKITELNKAVVKDAGLCHGSAGIAHIYNRMYGFTNDKAFKESAIYWFEKSVKMASHQDGLAGYKAFMTEEYGGYTNDYGFLMGIAGIGLAMISAVSTIEPKWDACLLIS